MEQEEGVGSSRVSIHNRRAKGRKQRDQPVGYHPRSGERLWFSRSAPEQRRNYMQTPIDGSNREDNIILLRESVKYTTKLKYNNSDEDDVFGLSTSDKPNTSSPSKFELSPAWSTLLQSDELDNKAASKTSAAWSTVLQSDGLENKAASTTTASLSELDGAYDLFSLPSDSSLATHSQRLSRDDLSSTGNSTKSSGALDRLPSRDDLSYMSMSTSSIQQPRRRKVSFDNTVTAATIPSR